MIGIKLFIVFLAALIVDGLIFPALFNFKNSLLSLLILIVTILYLGPRARYVVYGALFSVISEIFKGLNFGTLSAPFLLTVVVIYLAQMFLDIKYTYDTRFNWGKSVFLASVSAALIYLFLVFYQWGGISVHYFNPVIGLTVMLEAFALIFIFNVILNKKDYI